MSAESQSFAVLGLRQINFALASVNLRREFVGWCKDPIALRSEAKELPPPLAYA
jgi:hypothetical protein